jgi:hypothetical protein
MVENIIESTIADVPVTESPVLTPAAQEQLVEEEEY